MERPGQKEATQLDNLHTESGYIDKWLQQTEADIKKEVESFNAMTLQHEDKVQLLERLLVKYQNQRTDNTHNIKTTEELLEKIHNDPDRDKKFQMLVLQEKVDAIQKEIKEIQDED